jgi:hypothetical protein
MALQRTRRSSFLDCETETIDQIDCSGYATMTAMMMRERTL